MTKYVGVIALGVLAFAAHHWWGPIGVTRLFGAAFFGGAVWACFAPSLPVSFGDTEVARLTGWMKAIVLVPAGALGLAVLVYAPAVTCISYKYKYLCA